MILYEWKTFSTDEKLFVQTYFESITREISHYKRFHSQEPTIARASQQHPSVVNLKKVQAVQAMNLC
ncbi:hypothetical protein [Bacillus niameyensis]|uniref:hypothetical protein n=1 Tax=Bacillus niameyensis TaxID=1522308 RepID=UPI00078532C1|nr:hypothetical protein [Bacillus niameyensis]